MGFSWNFSGDALTLLSKLIAIQTLSSTWFLDLHAADLINQAPIYKKSRPDQFVKGYDLALLFGFDRELQL